MMTRLHCEVRARIIIIIYIIFRARYPRFVSIFTFSYSKVPLQRRARFIMLEVQYLCYRSTGTSLKSAGPAIQREEPFSRAQYHFNKVTSITLQSRRNTRFLFLKSQSSHNNRFEKIIRPLQVENTQKEMHWHEHHGPMPKDSSLLNLLFCQAAECVHDKGINEHANDNPRQVEELRNHFLDKGVYLSPSLVYHTAHNEEPRIDFYGQAGTYIVSK